MTGKSTPDLELGREALSSLASKAAMAAFGFVGVVVFANVLGPQGVGVYYFALAAGQLLAQVSGGLGNAIKKRVSEVQTDPAEYLWFGVLAHLAYTAAVLVAVVALRPVLAARVPAVRYPLGVAMILGSLGLFQVANRAYAGIGHPARASWLDTVRSVVTLPLQLGLLYLGYEAYGLIVGFAAASTLAVGVVLLEARARPAAPSLHAVGRVGAFARWSIPTALVSNVYARIDVLLIGVLVSSGAVGFYETALRMVQPAALLAASISGPLVVKASGLDSVDRDVGDDLRNAVSYVGLFAVPIFFGALAMPKAIMRTVFSAPFADAWPALVGLALFQVFNAYRYPFTAVVNGIDRPRTVFRVSLLTVAVNVPLAVALAFRYGFVGVVAATIVAEAIRVAAYQYVVRDVVGGFVFTRPIVEQVGSAAVMFVAVSWLTGTVLAIRSWFWLAVAVGTGAAVYFAVLLVVSAHFRLTLTQVLPDRVLATPVGRLLRG